MGGLAGWVPACPGFVVELKEGGAGLQFSQCRACSGPSTTLARECGARGTPPGLVLVLIRQPDHLTAARVRKPCLSEVGGLLSHLSGHGCCVPRGERIQRSASPLLTHSPRYSHGSSVNHARLWCPAVSLSLYWKSHRFTLLGHFDDS